MSDHIDSGRRGQGTRSTILFTLAVVTAVAALLQGCPAGPSAKEVLAEQEFAPYDGSGRSTIEGQVVLTLPSGETLYGSSGSITAVPVTDLTTQYVQGVVIPGSTTPLGKEAGEVRWEVTADANGRFRLDMLPAGEYYVLCRVAWADSAGSPKEAIAFARATVGPNQTATVKVTRNLGGPQG